MLLYRTSGADGSVLLARTTTTASGAWSLRRRFQGSGQFELYAESAGDAVLRYGRSDLRPTRID